MYRKPKPSIDEIAKSHRERSFALDRLKVEIIDGVKTCAWCGDAFTGRKYCSDPCRMSSAAWAYPQAEDALNILLQRQNFKCNICDYDYLPLLESIAAEKGTMDLEFRTKTSWYVMRRLKFRITSDRKPEVDHITPISKGGQSIGLDNHQAICYTCHKAKTKVDNSGPRKDRKKAVHKKCQIEDCKAHAKHEYIRTGQLVCEKHRADRAREVLSQDGKISWEALDEIKVRPIKSS